MFTHVHEKLNNQEILEVYRGKFFETKRANRPKRVVVLDLDETLGSFVDLEILWKTICLYTNDQAIKFNDLLDMYPEFLRYGIVPILEYLYNKKRSEHCYKVYIYTNNQSHPAWVQMLSDYFNNKIGKEMVLFDQIIHAFKINNRRIELKRTTHHKTHSDFIDCTLLPKRTAICFLDDVEYNEMKKERIYYIKPKAYRHSLHTNEIIQRFVSSKLCASILKDPHHNGLLIEDFTSRCKTANVYRSASNIDPNIHSVNLAVSRKIMFHIKEFFMSSRKYSQTKKRKSIHANFTRKLPS